MSERKLKDSIGNLSRAIDRLDEALNTPVDRALVMEGTIHRFEMAIELTWKTLRRALRYEGVQCETPRETLKAAHKAGWIIDETAWLGMVQRRNETSHEYLDEAIVTQNYEAARQALPHMKGQLHLLTTRYL